METTQKWPVTSAGWRVSLNRRAGYFWGIIFGGLFLEHMGGHWSIWIVMFILSGVGLALTYPTDKRLEKWIQMSKLGRTSS
jgi:hypothetical protein